MSKLFTWPKIILFGDSLTQYSFDPAEGRWGALLADKLQRTCDVIPRGFSGYNTKFCRAILPKVFTQNNIVDVEAFVILLGSNDCTSGIQAVPLSQYEENLEAMITYLKDIGLSSEKIILMNPPPYCDVKYTKFCAVTGRSKSERDLGAVALYSKVCSSVAAKFKLDNVNLYEEMLKNEDWPDYLIDGLHFSRKGSEKVFELLWPVIKAKVNVSKIIAPHWKDFVP